MNITTSKTDALTNALSQAKNELKTGLCDVFTTKLVRLAAHIRTNNLNTSEAAELLENEAETMRNQHYEGVSNV